MPETQGHAPKRVESESESEKSGVEKTKEELQKKVRELKEEVKRLEKMTLYDPLAESVYGRKAFNSLSRKEHARAVREGEPYAVFVLDLDEFKAVNDSLGHNAGDKIIKAVGAVCSDALRETDIVGRIGGDEFAGVLVGFRAQEEQMIRRKINDKFKEEMVTTEQDIRSFLNESGDTVNLEERMQSLRGIGFSMGIAEFRGEGTFEEVLHKADTNMYLEKEGRKGNG